MRSPTSSQPRYQKVVLYLKTISFARDNRAKKEIESLVKTGAEVEAVVFCDDVAPAEYAGARIIQYRGLEKSAPAHLALRAAAALRFSFFALRYARRASAATSGKTLHWVADPILFPLVIGLKKCGCGDVLWDHHELPPTWVLRGGAMTNLFVKAYQAADIVVHANQSRRNYLEEKIGARARRAEIINNYPKVSDLSSEKAIDALAGMVEKEKFVFLQNSLAENRCGPSIFAAVKQAGLKIIHAGNVTAAQKAALESKVGGIDQFCIFAGSLSLPEISWLLRRACCTVICYQQTSANQIYCEPNRLYHAMGMGTRIIAGNNPTMAEELENQAEGVVLADDGMDAQGIFAALEKMAAHAENGNGHTTRQVWGRNWDACENIIFSIVSPSR
ncbi:hypothetical protein GCM10027082_05120 [Comamonas humi]